MAPVVIRSSGEAKARSTALREASRSLIAASVVMLRRCRRIAGGTDAPVSHRAARTQSKLRRGGLPAALEAMTWAAPGSFEPCDGCGETISLEEVEYEIDAPRGGLRLHVECYSAWLSYPNGE